VIAQATRNPAVGYGYEEMMLAAWRGQKLWRPG
jgi:hypothetical protein